MVQTTAIRLEVLDIQEALMATINREIQGQVQETHIATVTIKETIVNLLETPIRSQTPVILLVAINHLVETLTVNQGAVTLVEEALELDLVTAIQIEEIEVVIHQNLLLIIATLTEIATQTAAVIRDLNQVLALADIIEVTTVQETTEDRIIVPIRHNQEVAATIIHREAQTDLTTEAVVALEEVVAILDRLEAEVHQDQQEVEVTADQDNFNMKKCFLASLVLLIIALESRAQYFDNYYMLSNYHVNGSARYTAMGGAFGALGVDPSSFHDNPAGIGKMVKSNISLSLGLYNNLSDNEINGQKTNSLTTKLVVPDFAVSLLLPNSDYEKWKNMSFGLSSKRLLDFKRTNKYKNDNTNYNLSQFFADDAFLVFDSDLADQLPFTSFLAFENYLINPDTVNYNTYTSEMQDEETNINFKENGRIQDWQFSFGANYNNKLYLGASFSYLTGSYNYTSEYIGTNKNSDTEDLQDYIYNFYYNSTIDGVNLKLGAIYKLNQDLQLGAYYHSPSWYFISESFDADLETNYRFENYYTESPFEGFGEFRVNNPSRLGFSAAYTNPKVAIFSTEIVYNKQSAGELLNLNDTDFEINFDADNNNISQTLRDVWIIKVGIEKAFKPFALRLGTVYLPSGHNTSIPELNYNKLLFSGGLGFQFNGGYFDLALQQQYSRSTYSSHAGADLGLSENKGLNIMTTVGFRF